MGAGCKACHTQYENTKDAVKNIGIDIEVEYITDMQKIMEYGVMSMPAIVVNDKVVAFGKVLKTAEVEKLLGGEIIKRYYYHRGYYAYMLRYDKQLERAVEEIKKL